MGVAKGLVMIDLNGKQVQRLQGLFMQQVSYPRKQYGRALTREPEGS